MLKPLFRRLLTSLLVVFGVTTIVFATLRLVPGDPVSSILGDQALQVDKDSLRHCLRLDQSLPSQYLLFWKDVATLSFGELCDQPGVTVADKLLDVIPSTFELAATSLLFAILIALPLGIISALKPYSWIDQTSAVFALLGIALPNFWLGPMLLILFSVTLTILPNPGQSVTGLTALILPAITLGSALSAKLTRMTRTSMLERLHENYIRTARAKGLPESLVIVKHALRGALIPVVTVLGLQFGSLLTGAIVVEKVFARPGIGTLLLDAIEQRNYMLVQGCVIFIAFAYIFVNLLVDLLYTWLNPRIRFE